MRFIILTALLMLVVAFKSSARDFTTFCNAEGNCVASQAPDVATDKWLLNINKRYYKSFRHFKCMAEQKQTTVTGMYNRSNTVLAVYSVKADLCSIYFLQSALSKLNILL